MMRHQMAQPTVDWTVTMTLTSSRSLITTLILLPLRSHWISQDAFSRSCPALLVLSIHLFFFFLAHSLTSAYLPAVGGAAGFHKTLFLLFLGPPYPRSLVRHGWSHWISQHAFFPHSCPALLVLSIHFFCFFVGPLPHFRLLSRRGWSHWISQNTFPPFSWPPQPPISCSSWAEEQL